MEPADIAKADQWAAKFADLLVRMMAELSNGQPDEASAIRFDEALQEIDGHLQLHAFVSYLVAHILSYHSKLDSLAEAMAVIQTVTINAMTDMTAKGKMIAAANDFRDEVEAKEGLFGWAEQAQPSEIYTTGTGQALHPIHRAGSCVGFCVIHSPITGPWDQWPTHWREDEHIMMRLCPHGIGHPCIEDVLRGGDDAHTCDGCECGPRLVEEKLQKALREELNRDETDSTGN